MWHRLEGHFSRIARPLCIFVLLISATGTVCADWPQFLGPTRSGVSSGDARLPQRWAKEGPRTIWKRDVGDGFSSPVVAKGTLVLFHRTGSEEIVEAVEATTGERLWQYKYAATYRDPFGSGDGPRATPTIDKNQVFTFGASGVLHCLQLNSGMRVWSVDTQKEFGASLGFFGLACSPLVESGLVMLNIGGSDGAGIVAFDRHSGKVRWKSTNHEASYSSPIAATIQNRRSALFFTRAGLTLLDPLTGKVRMEYLWRSRMDASVNAATPILIGDRVLISASYGTGASMLRIDDKEAIPDWKGDEILSCHYATPVHVKGYLYGFHGRIDMRPSPSLRCIQAATGKVIWNEESFGAGTLIVINEDLLILTENGQLLQAPASPDGLKITNRAQVLPTNVRAYPAFADGYVFVRSDRTIRCLDLRHP